MATNMKWASEETLDALQWALDTLSAAAAQRRTAELRLIKSLDGKPKSKIITVEDLQNEIDAARAEIDFQAIASLPWHPAGE